VQQLLSSVSQALLRQASRRCRTVVIIAPQVFISMRTSRVDGARRRAPRRPVRARGALQRLAAIQGCSLIDTALPWLEPPGVRDTRRERGGAGWRWLATRSQHITRVGECPRRYASLPQT
jgi:hypothetical protein